MKFTGKIQSVSKDWNTGKMNITFTINEPAALGELESIQNCEKLSIKATRYSEKGIVRNEAYTRIGYYGPAWEI